MEGVLLKGLVVERQGETMLVVIEGGMQIAVNDPDRQGMLGRLVAVRRNGGSFLSVSCSRTLGSTPSAGWEVAAAAWRNILGSLKAEHVLAALGEEDFSLRHAAEWELFHRGKQNLSLLKDGLSSPNWRIRAGCAGLMDHFADPSCGGDLVALLSDPHEKVRRAALHSVSCDQCKDEPLFVDWVPEVARLAKYDRIIRVRRIATLMLGARINDPRARDTILHLLNDKDGEVSIRARWALEGRRPEVGA